MVYLPARRPASFSSRISPGEQEINLPFHMHRDRPPSLFVAVDRLDGRSQKLRHLSLGLLKASPGAGELRLFHGSSPHRMRSIGMAIIFLYDIVVQLSNPFTCTGSNRAIPGPQEVLFSETGRLSPPSPSQGHGGGLCLCTPHFSGSCIPCYLQRSQPARDTPGKQQPLPGRTGS